MGRSIWSDEDGRIECPYAVPIGIPLFEGFRFFANPRYQKGQWIMSEWTVSEETTGFRFPQIGFLPTPIEAITALMSKKQELGWTEETMSKGVANALKMQEEAKR